MKYIELTGLPGSGKSSIFNELKITCSDKKNIFFGIDKIIGENIVPCDKVYRAIEKFSPPGVKKKLRALHFYKYGFQISLVEYIENNPQLLYETIDSISWNKGVFGERHISTLLKPHVFRWIAESYLEKNDLLVMDEGPVHKAITYYAEYCGSDILRKLESYKSKIGKIDLLVFLDCSNDESVRRLDKREKGHPKRLSGATTLRLNNFLNASRMISKYMCYLCEIEGAKVISIDTTNTAIGTAVNEINRTINETIL